MATVHIARGMRDFLPADMRRRLQVVGVIRGVFERFGFEPLATPALERIETLMGKYGEEGDRLVFKVLRRGEGGARGEVDLALRYDLTVPLARVVALHPELPMPFRRYQVQPVWRADRPQRGRFREFTQCDVDIVGSASRLAEAECLAVVHEALSALGFDDFRIRLNDRRLLSAMVAAAGAAAREREVLVALDKLDKAGREGVAAELRDRGLADAQVERLFRMVDGAEPVPGAGDVEAHLRGLVEDAVALGVPGDRIVVDRGLARGLDYYTGPVFEAVLERGGVGSVAGGGRYDGLVGMFAGREIPAVGVSLGLERLLVVMEERGMLPEPGPTARVLVTVFSEELRSPALAAARALRAAGVPTEVELSGRAMKKQLRAAARRGIPFVVVVGPDEAAAGRVALKDLRSGEQRVVAVEEAARIALAGST